MKFLRLSVAVLTAGGAACLALAAMAQQSLVQPAAQPAAEQPAAAASGPVDARQYISMCTGCHTIPGYQSSFPRVYHVPKISGQAAKYIEAALQAYRKGDRNHPTMQAIAASLTDQQIAGLAAYYAARGSEPTTVATK